jgi:hypothetical protein
MFVVMLLIVKDWLVAGWLVGVMLVDGFVAAPDAVGAGGFYTCCVPIDDDIDDDIAEFCGCWLTVSSFRVP